MWMILNMLNKLIIFEFKRRLFYSRDWLSNALFLLINMAIFPFTISPDPTILNQLFLSVIMTSMLLGIVLITSHIFDEDAADGSLNQLIVFGVPIHIIYLCKVIAVSCEFAIIITLVFPCAALFYAINFNLILQIWLIMLLAIPLLTSISVFGAILTINLKKSSVISILLIFPLLISALISLSLATAKILATGHLLDSLPYLEIELGLTFLFIPILCWLTSFLR